MCVCVCVCVAHEVKNQHAVVMSTSQIMLNGKDVHIQIGKWYYIGAPDRVNIPCLMHDTTL